MLTVGYPWLANQWLNKMSQTLTISEQVRQVFPRKSAETAKVFFRLLSTLLSTFSNQIYPTVNL